jgi:hypothetical protein
LPGEGGSLLVVTGNGLPIHAPIDLRSIIELEPYDYIGRAT